MSPPGEGVADKSRSAAVPQGSALSRPLWQQWGNSRELRVRSLQRGGPQTMSKKGNPQVRMLY